MPDSPDADDPAAGDDPLAGYDLHAWQAPPPPAGLADAVVARMTAPVAAHASAAARSPRLVVAAVVATLLAVAAVTVVVVTHGAPERDQPVDVAMAPPAPAHPTALPAGGGDGDAAKTRELEERVRRLEERLAELEAENRALRDPDRPRTVPHPPVVHPPVPPPPPPVPPTRPPPVDPLAWDDHSPFVPVRPPTPPIVPDDPSGLVDPFAQRHAASCDADALVAQGMAHINEAADAAALASFEAALHCRPGDHHAIQLAYMTACQVGDVGRARAHFQQLPEPDQTTLVQMCLRVGIDPRVAAVPGKLFITAKPPSRVLIDGVDTGKTTPDVFVLPAGRHKLTLQVGGDKYTYPVTIRAGETVKMTKDLE